MADQIEVSAAGASRGGGEAGGFLHQPAAEGGFGLFGDFARASENRFGGGFGETLSGPGIAFPGDSFGLTVGNLMELTRGEVRMPAGTRFATSAAIRRTSPATGLVDLKFLLLLQQSPAGTSNP